MKATLENIVEFIREKDANLEPYTEEEKEFLRSYEGGGQVKGTSIRGVFG